MSEMPTKRDPRLIDLTGQRFGRLVVIELADVRPPRWRVRCDCGRERLVYASHLRRGNTMSCGCLGRERATRHGHTAGRAAGGQPSAEYRIWCGIKNRCYAVSMPYYKHYGGRGIRVCDRWRDSFEAFLEDMGLRPSPRHSIDRIDVNGHYEPANCRWATYSEQFRNLRKNRFLTLNGETLIVSDWAGRYGIKRGTLSSRLALGWSLEAALTTPISSGFRPTGIERDPAIAAQRREESRAYRSRPDVAVRTRERQRERYRNDPVYRAKCIANAKLNQPVLNQQRRARRASDPEYRARENERCRERRARRVNGPNG